MNTLPGIESPTGATFSECRRYRYRLWRQWEWGPTINFLMLNPSTADDVKNDPTVERCERRAREYGFGQLVVTNLFSYRATDPYEMKSQADPIGPENNDHIVEVAKKADMVVCAWGNHGMHLSRGFWVKFTLDEAKVKLHTLGRNKSGEPKHPLYVGYDVKPTEWK